MADITMCIGGGCSLRDKCYRFLAIPSKWQSQFAPKKTMDDRLDCEHFWPIEKKERKTLIKMRSSDVD